MIDKQKYISSFSEILTLRDLSESTVNNYVSYLRQFLVFLETVLNNRLPEAATWNDVRAYISYLKDERGLNNRSINPHIAQLRDLFIYVLHRDWDPRQVPFLKYDEYLPSVPTKQEMERIIYTMKDLRYQCILAIMYSAGLRVSEAVALRYQDISRSRMQIHVSKSKNRSERKAILAHKTLNRLIWYWDQCGRPMSGYLFPGRKSGSHITTESVRKAMKNHLADLGMQDKGYTPHSCRHCFGLVLYLSGADLIAIRDLLGHKSLGSTLIYTSLGIGSNHGLTSPFDMEG